MSFETNVFINCPFDAQYRTLLRPLLFTIIYCELTPKISETESSGDIRIEKIKRLIKNSKYSIHDISRSIEPSDNKPPRLNMPYEFGLDIGCQTYGGSKMRTKKCLVFENVRYSYQPAISDIAGQDPKDHQNDPQIIVEKVREWFVKILKIDMKGPQTIWEDFNEFYSLLNTTLLTQGHSLSDIENLPFSEFIRSAKTWIRNRKKGTRRDLLIPILRNGYTTFSSL